MKQCRKHQFHCQYNSRSWCKHTYTSTILLASTTCRVSLSGWILSATISLYHYITIWMVGTLTFEIYSVFAVSVGRFTSLQKESLFCHQGHLKLLIAFKEYELFFHHLRNHLLIIVSCLCSHILSVDGFALTFVHKNISVQCKLSIQRSRKNFRSNQERLFMEASTTIFAI